MPSGSSRGAEPRDAAAELEALERLARLLDAQYGIPGTRFRFGLDAIIGVIPGVGDVAMALPAAFLVWRASQMGVSKPVLARMAANVGLDLLVGSVPIVGEVFDVVFKANRRNMVLLRRHLEPENIAGP